jgi:Ni,Fe-hydrogenase I cytochrome b subunit
MKQARLWIVNVFSFIFFAVLAFTGLISGFVLPGGPHAREGGWWTIRHFLREVHQWTALLFIACIVVHLILHWGYIERNLRKSGLLRSSRD